MDKDGAIIIEGDELPEVIYDDALHLRNKPLDFAKYSGPKEKNNRKAKNTAYHQPRNVPDFSKFGPPIDWTETNEHTKAEFDSTPLVKMVREVTEKFAQKRQKEKTEEKLMPEYHCPRASVAETAAFLEHHLYRCIFCEGDQADGHKTFSCPLSKAKKVNSLFDSKRCRVCFDTEHAAKFCPHDIVCQKCGKKHLTYFEHSATFQVDWAKVAKKQPWW